MNRHRSIFWLALVVLAAAGAYGIWLASGAGTDETAIKDQLHELGALVVAATDGRHVESVAMSTLKDPQDLQEALRLAGSLEQLHTLDLNRTQVEGADLQQVGEMTTLRSLSMQGAPIEDEDLIHLRRLQDLQSLNLSSTPVGDEGLPALGELRGLRILDLTNTQVSSDLGPLAKLPGLNWLLLRGTTLGEGALDPLVDAPALTRISLSDATYDKQSAEDLRRQRPELTIDE